MRPLAAPAALLTLLALAAPPAHALKYFLDHNTDDNLETFKNVAVALTVPVDIIVQVEDGDVVTGVPFGTVNVRWEYRNPTGDLYCWDTVGNVDFRVPIPDSPPFVNIFAETCVCRRCSCEAEFLIGAETDGPVAPGSYRLATLDFSRIGHLCGGPHTYPEANFELDCYDCDQDPNDPRQKMRIVEVFTSVEQYSWGKVRALYR